MKIYKILLTLFVFLITQSLALSQPYEDEGSSVRDLRLSMAPEDTGNAVDAVALRDLYERAHEAFETGEKPSEIPEVHASLIKEIFSKDAWLEKFNFKQVLLNALRWYQTEATNAQIKEHVTNLVLLLSISHMSEGVIGYQLGAMGLKVDNVFVNTLGVVMGVSIVIPGLDPLCILLGWTYKKIPHLMSKIMFVPRVAILSVSQFLYKNLGVKALYETLFYKQSAIDRLQELMSNPDTNREIIRLEEDVVFTIRHSEKTILRLEGRIADNMILWSRAVFSESLNEKEELEHFKKKISLFNWVLRRSLLDIVSRLESPEKVARLTYVDSVISKGNALEVQMRPLGMASPAKKRFAGFRNCILSLRSS